MIEQLHLTSLILQQGDIILATITEAEFGSDTDRQSAES
jgi:hypothetical protein